MSFENIKDIGKGGTGEGGQGSNTVYSTLKELQGLKVSLVAGAAANTKINIAAIRAEDTIVSAINNNAGTLTDITADVSIADVRASGTLTLASVVANDTAVVAGVTFTAKAAVTNLQHFLVGVDNDTTAANLAAAINKYFKNMDNKVTATAAAAVVTVVATAEGTGPNAYTLVGGAHITASGAVLSGGTTTGGIKSTSVTNQVLLVWFNKR